MALYRRQVRDRKTGKIKLSKVWTYDFVFAGRRIKESARTTSKTVAREAERRRRRELEEGYNGIKDARSERLRTLKGLAKEFLEDYGVRQPKSVAFADHALRHVV